VTVELGAPDAVTLAAPYPNPAGDRATIRYTIPEGRQDVQLELFDVMGRRVRTLVRGTEAGRHQHRIDVSGLSSGVYLLRLRVGTTAKTRRLTVVK
jgi:hypothetical protein